MLRYLYFYIGICTCALALSKPINETTYAKSLEQGIKENFANDFQLGSFGKNLPRKTITNNDVNATTLSPKIELSTEVNKNATITIDDQNKQLQRVQRDEIKTKITLDSDPETNKNIATDFHFGNLGMNLTNAAKNDAEDTIEQANNIVAIKQPLAQDNQFASAAVLHSKQILLQRLEKEIEEARNNVDIKTKQLEHVQLVADAAQVTSQQAQDQLKTLTDAVNNVQDSIIHSSQAALATAQELALQSSMVTSAKQKLFSLSRELEGIRIDYQATQSAARKAETAAKIAQANVGNDSGQLNPYRYRSNIFSKILNSSY